jgi:hypothetical protein
LNKKVIFAFSIGAAIGALISWKVTKDKYERIAQEKIAQAQEAIDRKIKNTKKEPEDIKAEIEARVEEHEEEVDEYKQLIEECGYSTFSRATKSDPEEKKLIYVIEPWAYGEMDGYDGVELTYWSDGVLTDDLDEPVDDIEGTIGYESLKHFGEYEDDSVCVRNEIRKVDYQILYDERAYSMAILEA